jgi:cytochrome b subunit of formate dehydrogenase
MDRDGRKVSLQVDPERFSKSVHAKLDCVACHADLAGVKDFPHAKGLGHVDCTTCHDDDDGPIAAYKASAHGRLAAAGNKTAPLCQDCHGSHEIARLAGPDSAISPLRIPAMCTQCHAEGAPIARSSGLSSSEVRARYPDRIHGKGLFTMGLKVTAACTSCHTGHGVLPASDPESTVHRGRVAETCSKCHGEIAEVHRKVVAPELWAKKELAPNCIDCHAPHARKPGSADGGISDAECLKCHGDAAEYAGSVHGRKGIACAQCHAGAQPVDSGRPCATVRSPVDCATCHAEAVAEYDRGRHGRLHATGDPNAPTCTDCHGTHSILEAGDRASPTARRNVPGLCARCHRDGAPAAQRNLGPESRIVENYTESIHGRALTESGLTVTAVCTDCHTAHEELPASDPASTVHPGNIPKTCAKCHDGIYETFRGSIHSREGNPDYVQLRGMPHLPDCNDCHSAHQVARTDRPAFELGIMSQCGQCHSEIAETYFETYHGKASTLGDATKAKCFDCHGAHDIRPASDPASHLAPGNVVATCAKCHPGSNEKFAGFLAHGTHKDRERYPVLYYVYVGMTALLLSTLIFFGLHTLLWLPHSWRMRKLLPAAASPAHAAGRQYVRFNRFYRALHLTVILSFFGLVITGMMLKYSHAPWARVLSQFLGGIVVAGWIHRVCAIATFGYMGLHLWDVGRRFLRSGKSVKEFFFGPDTLIPKPSDVREFFATMRWFLGRGPSPRYGRWTYWEKFDYFAVFWGVAIIGLTGLCLWFPEVFTRVLPGWAINVSTIVHSDEALLATGFIFTIHFFNTHFRPEKFPMDPVIFTGKMSLEELERERPGLHERLTKSGELERSLAEPASPLLSRTARIFGLSSLAVGLFLVALILYAMLFARS